MNLRLSISLAVPVLLAACSGTANPPPANTAGSSAGGASGTANPPPANTAGSSAGGASGTAAGASGLGSGGNTAGSSGGGSGGTNTAAGTGGAGPIAGMSGSGSTVPATFDTLKSVINQAPCFGAGCHNDAQNPLNLREDDQLYARLTSHISKSCGSIPVVNPGKPQESALVKILKGPCTATPRMPLGCVDDQDSTCLPAEYIAAITQWIANGAPRQ